MANEAVIIELLGNGGDPVRYTCADNVGIEKGTLLWLQDPRTVSGAAINANTTPDGTGHFAGIAAHEKVASDGSTSIAVYTNGIFDLTAVATGPAITLGEFLVISGANLVAGVRGPANNLSGARILGYSLETGSAGEVIAVKVRI